MPYRRTSLQRKRRADGLELTVDRIEFLFSGDVCVPHDPSRMPAFVDNDQARACWQLHRATLLQAWRTGLIYGQRMRWPMFWHDPAPAKTLPWAETEFASKTRRRSAPGR